MPDIPLGTKWLNCTLIYKNGSILESFDAEKESLSAEAIEEFSKQFAWHYAESELCDKNIWFDPHVTAEGVVCTFNESGNASTEGYRFFAKDQFRLIKIYDSPHGVHTKYKLVATKEHNFSSPKVEFLNSEYGATYLKRIRSNVPHLQDIPFHACSEFIIQDLDKLKSKYSGKSILIVGAGPSCNDIDWNPDEHDYIWACNKFYEHPKFQDIEVDCAAMAPSIETINNKELEDYIQRHPKTHINFETERGDYEKDWQKMYNFLNRYPEKTFIYGTRYRSAIGITARQICLAIFLGAKKISFVGLDGQTGANDLHAFEMKKEKPSWFLKFGSRFEARQFVRFWEYICELKNTYDFDIINLAEDLEYNMSSEPTKWLNKLRG